MKVYYGKLVNGIIYPYRQPLITDTCQLFTTNPEILAQYNYYPIIYTIAPSTDKFHIAVPHWEINNNQIIQVWNIQELPPIEDIPDEEALSIITGGTL